MTQRPLCDFTLMIDTGPILKMVLRQFVRRWIISCTALRYSHDRDFLGVALYDYIQASGWKIRCLTERKIDVDFT